MISCDSLLETGLRSRALGTFRFPFGIAARIVFMTATLAAGAPVAVASESGAPEPGVVLKRVVERAKWVKEQRFESRYTFKLRVLSEKLNSDGTVKSRKDRRIDVFPVEGEAFYKIVEEDGKPLTGDAQRKQKERENDFRRKVAERKLERKDDDELVNKYRYTFVAVENVGGRPALVYTFEPKSKDLPVKRRLDRLSNKFAGKVWIDEQDYEIARVEGHLVEEVTAWGGLIASIPKLELKFEQAKVDDEAWFPSRDDVSLEGRVFFTSLDQRQKLVWSDFKKIASAPAIEKAGSRR